MKTLYLQDSCGQGIVTPNAQQVLFINQDNIKTFDDFFSREYEKIATLFKKCDLDFIYLPKTHTPETMASILSYCCPYISPSEIKGMASDLSAASLYESFMTREECTDRSFNRIFEDSPLSGDQFRTHHNGLLRSADGSESQPSLEIPPVFYTRTRVNDYEFFELSEGSDEELWKQLNEYLEYVEPDKYEIATEQINISFSKIKLESMCNRSLICTDNDEEFPTEAFKLADEIKDKLNQLRLMGINELMIKHLLFHYEPQLSKLRVTKDFRIILDDYQKREIKMGPLPKTVFLLFLRHPQGIVFKNIHSYKEEVKALYLAICDKEMDKDMKMSIEHLTDPYYNSLNENCSRIRRAFLEEIDNEIAKYYYITGERATPKKIRLSPDMIIMEPELSIPLTIVPLDLPF